MHICECRMHWRACERACERACVRDCVRMYERASARASVYARIRAYGRIRALWAVSTGGVYSGIREYGILSCMHQHTRVCTACEGLQHGGSGGQRGRTRRQRGQRRGRGQRQSYLDIERRGRHLARVQGWHAWLHDMRGGHTGLAYLAGILGWHTGLAYWARATALVH